MFTSMTIVFKQINRQCFDDWIQAFGQEGAACNVHSWDTMVRRATGELS
jgi:hypothetical protein